MTFKLIILAIIFVLTSGAFFTDYFKQHKYLTFLAAIVAIISTLFLLQDIMSTIKDDLVADVKSNDTQNHSQQNSFQVQFERERQEKEALQAQLEASKKLEQELQEKAALKAELEALKKQREQELQEQAVLEAKLKLEQEQQEKAALEAKLKKLEQEQKEKAATLQAKLEPLKKKNEFTPGKVFRDRLADGSDGPEMVMIPAGSFRMGDIQGGGDSDEKPAHEVSVGKFAMGKYEVTFAEYDKFAEATDRSKPNDIYGLWWRWWGYDNHPVINVSWNDATAYAEWLSEQTGKQYRLPTETEWEYAARAGTTTKYWWGNDIGKNKANCSKDYCGDSFKHTSPVGSFAANKFSLYDTSGNVWEWTCSEYTDKYTGREKDCIAKNSNKNRVLRGGSLNDDPWYLRAANRYWGTPDDRNEEYGFRVVVLSALFNVRADR